MLEIRLRIGILLDSLFNLKGTRSSQNLFKPSNVSHFPNLIEYMGFASHVLKNQSEFYQAQISGGTSLACYNEQEFFFPSVVINILLT